MNSFFRRSIRHASVPRIIVTWGGSRVSLSRIFTFQRAFVRAAVNGNVYAYTPTLLR